ncbi:glycolate oxidase iron-sulfur subunit [Halopolyspora algeriensis]|uniref:Glycolate oxidase iron-sulfur subunit n=1 Tax=Halopolyspora algeriensis TaxID=1500506 RepID=A0A368VU70_9ACTN|nr:heterodisulfide reductase-related iron-sulfur binding cluster [Halopolyspora algeriensis]RCW45295.1 glycolate oxidase iron-sulfur subunit [Halopolyspora algeriensis]TQM47335.1 glycolate oxidase iron-sulfur subunit [Halopolyspora algeriensis]
MADNTARPGTEGAFDAFHPPQRELVDDCVHCGFCLPSCPTYDLWGQEMDSPRGRIHLMEAGLDGEPLSESMVDHFDNCLGCMACVTACPSGVQYGTLITETRAQVERRHRRGFWERALRGAIFSLFPYPRRLRAMRGPLALYQRFGLAGLLRRTGLLAKLPEHLQTMESLAPPIERAPKLPERVRAHGQRRAVVGMITGCVQSAFFPGVNAATARVLAAEGCDVVIPAMQGCCGALSEHSGRESEAVRFARGLLDRLESAEVDYIVINSAGCGSTLKEYPRLLADDPDHAERAERFSARVRDISELLGELGTVAERHPLPAKVAYHDACHLSHGQGIRTQPRELLRAVPGLELREINRGELCCGSAGVYNLLQPRAAAELGDRKADNVLATDADMLVTANPGCSMQIRTALERREKELAMAHTVEVLDASIRGLGVEALLRR